MTNQALIEIESDWLPVSELERLVGQLNQDFPSLAVQRTTESTNRAIDPTIAVALITGTFSILVPLITKLIDKVFEQEPKAKITIKQTGDERSLEIVVDKTMSKKELDTILESISTSSQNLPKLAIHMEK